MTEQVTVLPSRNVIRDLIEVYEEQNPGSTLYVRACGHLEAGPKSPSSPSVHAGSCVTCYFAEEAERTRLRTVGS